MEKEKFNFKDFLKEVLKNIARFFKPIKGYKEFCFIPKELKSIANKVGVLNLITAVITLAFGFILKFSNLLIESKLIIFGIMAFLLYRSRNVLSELYRLIQLDDEEKLENLLSNNVISYGGNIITETFGRVFKKEDGFYVLMKNEDVFNSINNYVTILWRIQLEHRFEFWKLGSVIVMLIAACISNTEIPQYIFIPLLAIFIVLSFVVATYVSQKSKEFRKKEKQFNNAKSRTVNDMVRNPNVVDKDAQMRIARYRDQVNANSKKLLEFHKKRNRANLVLSILEIFSQYGIIIIYLIMYNASNSGEITLATITEVSAVAVVLQTALEYVSRIARMFARYSEKCNVLENEKEDMDLIMAVYKKIKNEKQLESEIDKIELDPFCVKYPEASKNDIPFTLINKGKIVLEKGDVAILNGPSGSGKSTLMKLITERILLKKSNSIPATHRYAYFDESLRFGSLSIYVELFCKEDDDDSKDDREKMKSILENLHLWQELSRNCVDVWKSLKDKNYNDLSNGQKQRILLAKLLYWLDEDIDVVVLDEATSGLDSHSDSEYADAERTLEYLVNYCNHDKKRIVVIATHQEIDGFKEKMKEKYTLKEYEFIHHEEFNEIVTKN